MMRTIGWEENNIARANMETMGLIVNAFIVPTVAISI